MHRSGIRQRRHRQDLFTAGVGAALTQGKQRVLCLDCDAALRNLDLALGLSDRVLMDFSDVAQGRCPWKAPWWSIPSCRAFTC